MDIDWTSRPEFTEALAPVVKSIRSREVRNANAAVRKLHEEDARYAPLKKSA